MQFYTQDYTHQCSLTTYNKLFDIKRHDKVLYDIKHATNIKPKEKSPKQTAGVIYSVINEQSFAYHSSDVIDMFLVFTKEVICFF